MVSFSHWQPYAQNSFHFHGDGTSLNVNYTSTKIIMTSISFIMFMHRTFLQLLFISKYIDIYYHTFRWFLLCPQRWVFALYYVCKHCYSVQVLDGSLLVNGSKWTAAEPPFKSGQNEHNSFCPFDRTVVSSWHEIITFNYTITRQLNSKAGAALWG